MLFLQPVIKYHTTMSGYDAHVQELITRGVTTIPCLTPDELLRANELFFHVTRTLPELRTDVPEADRMPAFGGFGALGLPSSFHHPFYRRLRELVYARVAPFFAMLLRRYPGYKLEQLIDRVQLREKNTSPTAESFHRDECNEVLVNEGKCSCDNGDLMFGGWLNLDTQAPQGFSCVPGTHRPGSNFGRGFTTIKKEDKKQYKSLTAQITNPPGHILIFFANIVHEVLPKKRKYTSARMYCCWRATQQDVPLFPDTLSRLRNQKLMPLPSGQMPPMHAKLHWTNWSTKLAAWSQKTVKDQYLVNRTFQSGSKKGTVLRVVPNVLEHGSVFYDNYEPMELLTYRPHDPRSPLILQRNALIEHAWPRILRGDFSSVVEKSRVPGRGEMDDDMAPLFIPAPPGYMGPSSSSGMILAPPPPPPVVLEDNPLVFRRPPPRRRVLPPDDEDEELEEVVAPARRRRRRIVDDDELADLIVPPPALDEEDDVVFRRRPGRRRVAAYDEAAEEREVERLHPRPRRVIVDDEPSEVIIVDDEPSEVIFVDDEPSEEIDILSGGFSKLARFFRA
jgi:hypothetical protein